jgi:hypothetical protein
MKRLFFISIILLASCSSDDDAGDCECKGKFQRANDTENYFYANGVDCDTGEPALSQQNEGEIGQTNPAFFIGCDD